MSEQQAAEYDRIFEWRESVGIAVMHAMTCTHKGDEFGPRAVCVTCFENTQQIGALIERYAARAWEQGRAAERRDWELTTDLSTPELRQPMRNPYHIAAPTTAGEGERGEG